MLGRRDARTASWASANKNLPQPTFSFSQLVSSFQAHGLRVQDLVALSGAHNIGFARCTSFGSRIYNDVSIDTKFAASVKRQCPRKGRDNNLESLDPTPARIDTSYYMDLLQKKGLLHSDQQLFKGQGSESNKLVELYSKNPLAFARDFKAAMIKMGNGKPLTGKEGEIRTNWRRFN